MSAVYPTVAQLTEAVCPTVLQSVSVFHRPAVVQSSGTSGTDKTPVVEHGERGIKFSSVSGWVVVEPNI